MPSNVLNLLLPCLRKEGGNDPSTFLENGSTLLEDLIASCDGRCNIPLRHYSSQELIRATNNFDSSGIIPESSFYYRGFLENRLIIIKKRGGRDGPYRNFKRTREEAIRDIIISMQMSSHKNVLKLLGCCLDFPVPALVHEYATQGCVLNDKGGCRYNEYLPWNNGLRIAKQLATAITYLHTGFPRPIIHRHLRPQCIFLDDDFVPKLCDFSYSITLPPEKSHVEDVVIKGTMWYLSPEFLDSGYISEKFDVYSFGVLLLGLLAGRKPLAGDNDLIRSVKLHAANGQIQTFVDPKIFEELGGDNESTQQQLQDFLALAWLCTHDETELRPDMIDVAKELMRIERSISPASSLA